MQAQTKDAGVCEVGVCARPPSVAAKVAAGVLLALACALAWWGSSMSHQGIVEAAPTQTVALESLKLTLSHKDGGEESFAMPQRQEAAVLFARSWPGSKGSLSAEVLSNGVRVACQRAVVFAPKGSATGDAMEAQERVAGALAPATTLSGSVGSNALLSTAGDGSCLLGLEGDSSVFAGMAEVRSKVAPKMALAALGACLLAAGGVFLLMGWLPGALTLIGSLVMASEGVPGGFFGAFGLF